MINVIVKHHLAKLAPRYRIIHAIIQLFDSPLDLRRPGFGMTGFRLSLANPHSRPALTVTPPGARNGATIAIAAGR